MNVLNSPRGQRPKTTDVSPWYGVYITMEETGDYAFKLNPFFLNDDPKFLGGL